MCNPIALMAGQLVTTLWGQHQQTKAQTAMYNAQAQAAEANARISDRILPIKHYKSEIRWTIKCG